MAARRRFRLGFVLIALVALALVAWVLMRKPPAKESHAPVASVTVAPVTLKDVPVSITALGAAQAWKSATVRAQVSGRLMSADFTEGSDVRAGQRLAQVDPAPFRAVLTQAEGVLARDSALLENARRDLARVRMLAAQDSVSRQAADTQAAVVKQDEGIVQTDKGVVQTARINLGWSTIAAPISGRVGVRLVDPGNLVGPSDATGLVIINQIEPIAVTFSVPQGQFQRLVDLSQGFRRPLAVEALSQETGAPLGQGVLTIADNRIDPNTGAITLKARFPNADHRLWPGQFVNVRLTLQTLRGATTLPTAAVNQGPKGPFAYVPGPGGKVAVRPLTLGPTQGDTAVILAGVKAGEMVVTDGQLTLRPGAAIRIKPLAGDRPRGHP